MKNLKNTTLTNKHGHSFLCDAYFPENNAKGIVVFVHGFKGFKDWGHWEEIAYEFVEHEYIFIKFNFSHNGTTLDSPFDFDDLERFGQNNYSLEWADIDAVINWIEKDQHDWPVDQIKQTIFLIGHSRGGAICMAKAMDDERIQGVIGWASVDSLDYAWKSPGFVKKWEKEGKYEIINGRTKQIMPLYYQFYEDYQANLSKFDIEKRLPESTKPILLIHGTNDPAISHKAAEHLNYISPNSKIHLIRGADHVFGGRHPFEGKELPEHSQELVKVSLGFLDANSS